MLQFVEGNILNKLRLLDFLNQRFPRLFQQGESLPFRRQGFVLETLRATRLSEDGPDFLHRRNRLSQSFCHP